MEERETPGSAGRKGSRQKQASSPGSARKRSRSPPKSAGKKGQLKGAGTKKDHEKEEDTTGDGKKEKKTKKITIKEPELLTEDGLKIVHFSGKGLTSVPLHILGLQDLGELSLAANNLREIPPTIKCLTALRKLDISKNGIRCTHPTNDFNGIPREICELPNLVEIKIAECNLPYIPPAIWGMENLQVLDVSRNKINTLVPEVGKLINLKRINLQQTNINMLPPEIAFCQELEEIFLWGNIIESLPETLPEMPKLRTLAVNYRNFSAKVDEAFETLIRTGQIKSDHIPVVVFELATLEVLDLQETKINNVPDMSNHGLKEFYLCNNFFQVIPKTLFNQNHLEALDVSHNMLKKIPDEIGNFVALQRLLLCSNTITRLPPTAGKLLNLIELNLADNKIQYLPTAIKGLKQLQSLHLEKNEITSLPDELCELVNLETLDLSENKITQLPMKLHQLVKITAAHSYNKFQKYGLWLYKNPLVQPPPEVWKTEKPDKIFEYLRKLAIIKTENLQRQKLLLFGETQCGKTSLMNTLIYKKSQLTLGHGNKTRGLVQIPWKSENNVEFLINDFGGDWAYRMMYPLFVDPEGLVLLVYNHRTYSPEMHHASITQWLDFLNVHAPGIVVKLVGTHSDKCKPRPQSDEDDADIDKSKKPSENTNESPSNVDEKQESTESTEIASDTKATEFHKKTEETKETAGDSKEICEESDIQADITEKQLELVREGVKKYMEEHQSKLAYELQAVQNQIEKLKGSNSNQTSSSSKLEHLQTQKARLEYLIEHPLRIQEQISVISSSETLEGINELINSLELMTINTQLFPNAQRSIPDKWNKFRAMLKRQKTYYLEWGEVEAIAENFDFEMGELFDCIQYLHDTGEVLWYRNIPSLSKTLFHKPRVLIDLVSSMYRHDVDEFFDYKNNKIFISKAKFSPNEFHSAQDIFVKNGQISRPMLYCFWFYQKLSYNRFNDLLDLLPLFEICYSIPEPEVPKGKNFALPLMVLPWYNRDEAHGNLGEYWGSPCDENSKNSALMIKYEFPLDLPEGVFERIVSAVQEIVLTRIDWKDAIMATTDNEKFRILKGIQKNDTLASIQIDIHNKYTMGKNSQMNEVNADDSKGKLAILMEITQVISDLLMRTPGLVWKIIASDALWDSHNLCYTVKSVHFEVEKQENQNKGPDDEK